MGRFLPTVWNPDDAIYASNFHNGRAKRKPTGNRVLLLLMEIVNYNSQTYKRRKIVRRFGLGWTLKITELARVKAFKGFNRVKNLLIALQTWRWKQLTMSKIIKIGTKTFWMGYVLTKNLPALRTKRKKESHKAHFTLFFFMFLVMNQVKPYKALFAFKIINKRDEWKYKSPNKKFRIMQLRDIYSNKVLFTFISARLFLNYKVKKTTE